MCVCKKEQNRQDFNQNRLGPHGSEPTTERLVFRVRTGSLCSSEYSKMYLCGHHERSETSIGTVSARVFDVCGTKVMDPMNHLCEGIVFACHPN